MVSLFAAGYAATDIIQTIFRVTKSNDMPEPQKLDYIREIGFTHMRISEGLNTQLQLIGCIARMCNMVHNGTYSAVVPAPVSVFKDISKMHSSTNDKPTDDAMVL